MLLTVAVDAPHPLLEAARVPRDVVVDHQPAELEVDALTRSVGRDQVGRSTLGRWSAEELHLLLACAVVHAAVYLGHLAAEAETLETPHQKSERVSMLGEDNELLVLEPRVAHDLAELGELRLVAGFMHPLGEIQQFLDLPSLLLEVGQGNRHDAAKGLLLFDLVLLAAVLGALFVGGHLVERVVDGQTLLESNHLLGGQAPRLDVVDQGVQFGDAALKRPHQGVGGACEPPLEHAHGEPRGGAVEDPRAVVVGLDIACSLVVQLLLTDFPLAEFITQRVGHALGVDARAVVADHLLLGPTDEVALADIGWAGGERGHRGEHLWFEQSPEAVVGELLPHMGRGGQKEHVMGVPIEMPARAAIRGAREGLGEPVALGLSDGEVRLPTCREFVCLIEDNKIVGLDIRFLEPGEHPGASQSVHTDDQETALLPHERVAGTGVAARGDDERKAEQGAHLALPVPDQTGRGDDEHAANQAARQHLPDVKPGHDGLAGACIIGEQEPQPGLREHPLVHGEPLVRQRLNERRLGREGGVEEVAVGEALPLSDD